MTRFASADQTTPKVSGRDIALGLLGLAAVALAERLLAKANPSQQPPEFLLSETAYGGPSPAMRTEDAMTDAVSRAMAREVAEAKEAYGDAYAAQIAESNARIAVQMLGRSQASSQGLAEIAGNLKG